MSKHILAVSVLVLSLAIFLLEISWGRILEKRMERFKKRWGKQIKDY